MGIPQYLQGLNYQLAMEFFGIDARECIRIFDCGTQSRTDSIEDVIAENYTCKSGPGFRVCTKVT